MCRWCWVFSATFRPSTRFPDSDNRLVIAGSQINCCQSLSLALAESQVQRNPRLSTVDVLSTSAPTAGRVCACVSLEQYLPTPFTTCGDATILSLQQFSTSGSARLDIYRPVEEECILLTVVLRRCSAVLANHLTISFSEF